ncbi:MAG: AMP-binding protein [Cyclobacteriaceae bacterium]
MSDQYPHLKTPLDWLYKWESEKPDDIFLSQPINGKWITFTWKEFGEQVRKMAATIDGKGLPEKSKIALLSKNCAHWLMTDMAIMMSGHVSVPIYPNVSGDTVKYILEHSEAKLLFVGKLEASDWENMSKGVPDGLDCIDFGIYGLAKNNYQKWDDEVGQVAAIDGNPKRDLDDIMTIIYTSGTTGVPKGVVHKFIAPVYAGDFFVNAFKINQQDRFFSYLPLSHIAERMLTEIVAITGGASVHYVESLEKFQDNLKECQPTIFLAVPRIWAKFMSGVQSKFSDAKLNFLLAVPLVNNIIKKKIKEALGLTEARVCLTGAAPMAPSMMNWYDKLGICIFEVYGMTENSAYSHANYPGKRKIGTVGPSLVDVETIISEEGEICIKSPTNMVEYYKEPDKTAEALKDGFLHTGDKGEIGQDGFVKITGRVKDIFKTSKGKYVAPNPIEMQLIKNEHIEQVCVVGSGIAQPLALVELTEKAIKSEKSIVEQSLLETLKGLNPKLDHHEKLQKVVVVKGNWTPENGIMTPTMKIKRNEVDNRYKESYENWYESEDKVAWE